MAKDRTHYLPSPSNNKNSTPQKFQNSLQETRSGFSKNTVNKKEISTSKSQGLKKKDENKNGHEPSQELIALLAAAGGLDAEVNDDSEKNVRDYFYSVRKYLWLIISITLLNTLLVAVYMARKPDVFVAEASLEVIYENNPAVNATQSAAVNINNPANSPNYINTQLRILTGTGFLRRVVKTLDLEQNPDFLRPPAVRNHSTWKNLQRMFGIGGNESNSDKDQEQDNKGNLLPDTPIAPVIPQDDLAEAKRLAPYVGVIKGGLVVEQPQNTSLITIYYKHLDPHIAAKVANAIAQAFVYANLEKMVENSNGVGSFLQKRVTELQEQIRGGEERLIDYTKNKQMLSLDPGQNIVVDRLNALNRQLLEAENERKLAEAAYNAAMAPGAADALTASGTGQSGAEQRLAELRTRRAQLLVQLTEENPEIKEIDEQIATLQKQITDAQNRARSVLLTNLETRYKQSLAREQASREAFEKQKRETITQNEAAINYRIIEQEIQTNKTLLNGLLQRYKEYNIFSIGASNNIHIADYAITPDSPVGPKRMQAVGIAFLASLALGFGIAILLGYLDDSLRSPLQVERVVGLPALAAIPPIKPVRKLLSAKSTDPLMLNSNYAEQAHLLLNGNSHSPLAEIFRKLRTSIMFSGIGKPPCTLLVTSSLPAEGKTTTAANTALILAQTAARVIIVDADFRNPSIHKVLSMSNKKGLEAILTSNMKESEMLELIQEHEKSSLYVLTSGNEVERPSELLVSEKMRQLLSVLQTYFDYIVIDSPPVIPFTDGVLLSSMVDGVLLVAQSGKSSCVGVKSARKMLESTGAKILGVVLNKANVRVTNDYYYDYYKTRNDE
jgi:capsular exopolysaccharide synthesis family protein